MYSYGRFCFHPKELKKHSGLPVEQQSPL